MAHAERLYMLDTNIISDLMERPGSARLAYCQQRLDELDGPVAISVIVQAEVFAGLEKKPSKRMEQRLQELMRGIRVEYLHPGLWFSDLYACIKSELQLRGEPLDQIDMAIAAHAMAVGATLVSRDKGFERIDGLKLESWSLPGAPASRSGPGVAEPVAIYRTASGLSAHDLAVPPAPWMLRSPDAGYASAHAR